MNLDVFDDIKSMICISDYDTSDVIYLNRCAREHFRIVNLPEGLKHSELLAGDEYFSTAFLEQQTPGDVLTKVIPTLCGLPGPILLEHTILTDGDRRLRFCSFRPIVADGENSDSLYTMMFESAYLHIDANYHGIDFPDENIRECLSAAYALYEAGSAYILDIDEELDAGEYLCLFNSDGYVSSEYEVKNTVLFSNLFSGIIKKGEPFVFTTEALKDTHPKEYAWLCQHGIFNAMGVPFRTRADMVPFLVVDNVRRFWGKTSFLSMATRALYNEIRAVQMLKKSVSSKHSNKELWEGEVIINLFGGFEIHTNQGSLDLANYSSLQCSKFVLYLLKNRNRTIPVREIADVLWPDQLMDNPYNMVKGVAFRVRRILDSICSSSLVVARAGTYAINDKLMIILDSETFDKLCDQTHNAKKTSCEKQHLYEKLLRLYKGDMLPNFESEIWLIGWIGYYQMKYLEILKDYLALLLETQQYGKIFEVVSNVQSIAYGDGEICMFLIQAFLRQNRPELAKSYYMRVEKYLSAMQRNTLLNAWDRHRS